MRDNIIISELKNDKVIKYAPKLFSVSGGDNRGEVDLQWDPVPGANLYVLQISIHSEKNLKWTQVDIITRSSYTISGLRSGRKYCFRISAVNSFSCGPWSKIIKKSVQ